MNPHVTFDRVSSRSFSIVFRRRGGQSRGRENFQQGQASRGVIRGLRTASATFAISHANSLSVGVPFNLVTSVRVGRLQSGALYSSHLSLTSHSQGRTAADVRTVSLMWPARTTHGMSGELRSSPSRRCQKCTSPVRGHRFVCRAQGDIASSEMFMPHQQALPVNEVSILCWVWSDSPSSQT